MRPDLGSSEKFNHGTRARYVTGCRCTPCRASNTAYYHVRQKRAKELAQEIVAPPQPVAKLWTNPSGELVARTYSRACPGTDGVPCGRHLRKDSKGGVCGVCGVCREKLVWNGLVPAGPARKHLRKLSSKGIGRRSVADASGVSLTVIFDVATGKKKKIKRETEKKLLAVDEEARAAGSLVPTKMVLKILNKLKALDLDEEEIAERLGYRNKYLQFVRPAVTAKNLFRMERLHRLVLEEFKYSEGVKEICLECGLSHAVADRLRVLGRRIPAKDRQLTDFEVQELRHIWPLDCFYEKTNTGYIRLRRDLISLGVSGNKRRKTS